jgi:hypothetical protein
MCLLNFTCNKYLFKFIFIKLFYILFSLARDIIFFSRFINLFLYFYFYKIIFYIFIYKLTCARDNLFLKIFLYFIILFYYNFISRAKIILSPPSKPYSNL